VWEFASFHLGGLRTLRIVGVNPAIILVQGEVTVEPGATIKVTGDGQNGTPNSRGGNGDNKYNSGGGYPDNASRGVGVAGGGDGADGVEWNGANVSEDGYSGFGSPSPYSTQGGTGAGEGNVRAVKSTTAGGGTSPGGGGGGHSTPGGAGEADLTGPVTLATSPAQGAGGVVYPVDPSADRMQTPSAGSGGGASGGITFTLSTYGGYQVSGSAGGAGGGFLDITSQGTISIFGTIDASGGRGGNGAATLFHGTGGGGGGAGGGIRLLTPADIVLSDTTKITTAGGAGGTSGTPTYTPGAHNKGGAGGNGRIVLEDGDSVITGLGSADVMPGEGSPGFYRGVFDATRFTGGGLAPWALTEPFAVGPLFSVDYQPPAVGDVIGGIPTGMGRGLGKVGVLIEARGYALLPDGTPDPLPSGWHTIGYLADSGVASQPTWKPNMNPAVPADLPFLPNPNAPGIDQLDGYPFLEFRITCYLPSTAGVFDAGPYLDRLVITFDSDT